LVSSTIELTAPAPRPAPRTAVLVLGAILALALAYDLWRMPVQVSDSLAEILAAQASPSIAASFDDALGTTSYLRPLRIAQIKALFDASNGHYRLAYRGFHAALIVALILLFARALPIESSADAAAAIFALTVLTGLHTFLGFLREAFPINHFLEMALFAVVALNLVVSRGGWWADALAALTFVCATLTLESGVLVWVVLAAAWLCGLRGVSTRGVMAVTLLLAAYLALRFWYLDTGLPSLSERASGFLFERLEPRQLQERFGESPLIFYGYNVVVSLLTVLFSEPRDGLFVATRAWNQGDVHPQAYLTVGSSAALTVLIALTMIWRWWRGGPLGRAERLAIVAVAVILANAAVSFSYAKDDIVAIGGVFYAIVAFAAVRSAIEFGHAGPTRAVVVSAVLLALGTAWAVRSSGVHFVMSEHAFRVRNDWAELPLRWQHDNRWPTDPAQQSLINALRNDALGRAVPNPQLAPEWKEQWYGD
jgi:hypothetical protein